MSFRQEIKRDDCPNCGRKEGGSMGSSQWGHAFMCCNESCGVELKEKIEANTSTPEFSEAIVEIEEARQKARDIKYRDLPIEYDPFEEMNGRV